MNNDRHHLSRVSAAPPSSNAELNPLIPPSNSTNGLSGGNKLKQIVERFHLTSMSVLSSHSSRFRGGRIDLRSRDRLDASAKKGFRVTIPTRMLLYIAVVFFIVPLFFAFYILLNKVFASGAHHDDHLVHLALVKEKQQHQENGFVNEGAEVIGLRGAGGALEGMENGDFNAADHPLSGISGGTSGDGDGVITLNVPEAKEKLTVMNFGNENINGTMTAFANEALMKDGEGKGEEDNVSISKNGDLAVHQSPSLTVSEGRTDEGVVTAESSHTIGKIVPDFHDLPQQEKEVLTHEEGEKKPPSKDAGRVDTSQQDGDSGVSPPGNR